jgi:hypothetical protein
MPSATHRASPQHSPAHSPLLAFRPLAAKAASPPTVPLALDALTSAFGFPEPPARPSRLSGAEERRSSPPPRRRRLPRHAAQAPAAPRTRRKEEWASGLPSEAHPHEAGTRDLEEDEDEYEQQTPAGSHSRLPSGADERAPRRDSAGSFGEAGDSSFTRRPSRASQSEDALGLDVSQESGMVRSASAFSTGFVSSPGSSIGEPEEMVEEDFTDGSAGGMSFSSDGEYHLPTTPASAHGNASGFPGTLPQWRPRELQLVRSGSEEAARVPAAHRFPLSISPSPSYSASAPQHAARRSPAKRPPHMRATSTTSSGSGSSSAAAASSATGPRDLLLASAAVPAGAIRSLTSPSLSVTVPLKSATRSVSPVSGGSASSVPRSPLPVLSTGPAFPPGPDATLESMAAERLPNESLATPARRAGGSGRISPMLTPGSASGASLSVSPVVSAPSWEMPTRAYSPLGTASANSSPLRPLVPLPSSSSAATSPSSSPQDERVPLPPTRARAHSFVRSSASTSRRKPPAPLDLAGLSANPGAEPRSGVVINEPTPDAYAPGASPSFDDAAFHALEGEKLLLDPQTAVWPAGASTPQAQASPRMPGNLSVPEPEAEMPMTAATAFFDFDSADTYVADMSVDEGTRSSRSADADEPAPHSAGSVRLDLPRLSLASSHASSGGRTVEAPFEFDYTSEAAAGAEASSRSGSRSGSHTSDVLAPMPASPRAQPVASAFESPESSYSTDSPRQSQVTPSSSRISFRTSMFQVSVDSPRGESFGPRGTPDLGAAPFPDEGVQSGDRPSTASSASPRQSIEPVGLQPAHALRPGSLGQHARRPQAMHEEQTPGSSSSSPARSVVAPPPRPTGHASQSEPLPTGEWRPTPLSVPTRASISSGNTSPVGGVSAAPAAGPPSSRPNLSIRTMDTQNRPLPPLPRSKPSIVPDTPSFGFMPFSPAPPTADAAYMSPPAVGSSHTPQSGTFSVDSAYSDQYAPFEQVMSSRWSSGSESDDEPSGGKSSRKNSKAKKTASANSSKRPSASGSMGPPAAPLRKGSAFLQGLGLRKKSFSNAAAPSPSQRSASPHTPGIASPAMLDTAAEFPFPPASQFTPGSPSVATRLSRSPHVTDSAPRSRAGSVASRYSQSTGNSGPSMSHRPSLASLRMSSMDQSRRPSLTGDGAESVPASPSLPSGFAFPTRSRNVSAAGSLDAELAGLGIALPAGAPYADRNRPTHASRLSNSLRSARASLNNLRASKDLAAVEASANALAAALAKRNSQGGRQRSATISAADLAQSRASIAAATQGVLLPDVTTSPPRGEARRRSKSQFDEFDTTPRVAYASLPGSGRSSIASPTQARSNLSRYVHDDEALTRLGSHLVSTASWADFSPESVPSTPPVPARGSSTRAFSGRRSDAGLERQPSPLVESVSATAEKQPAPRRRRIIYCEGAQIRPHYPSLSDFGRAWCQEHPGSALEAARGPALMAAALAARGYAGAGEGGNSGASTPSDASTDYYGSSDGGGGADGDASDPGEPSGSGGAGDEDDPEDRKGNGAWPSRAARDALLASDEEEISSDDDEDIYGVDRAKGSSSALYATANASSMPPTSDAIDPSGSTSRSAESDDVPLGERVQNAEALQSRLRAAERREQIASTARALERGGRHSKSDRLRKPRGFAPEKAPDSSPLDINDLMGRLQKVQVQQAAGLPTRGPQQVAPSGGDVLSSANLARVPQGRARSNTTTGRDQRLASAPVPTAPVLPAAVQQQQILLHQQQQIAQQQAQIAQQAQLLQSMKQQTSESAPNSRTVSRQHTLAAASRAAAGVRPRPSFNEQVPQRLPPNAIPADARSAAAHKAPTAALMFPSSSSSGASSPAMAGTPQLGISSTMAGVVSQAQMTHRAAEHLRGGGSHSASPALGTVPLRMFSGSAEPSADGHAAPEEQPQVRLRSRSISRARPNVVVDARVAPPLPVPVPRQQPNSGTSSASHFSPASGGAPGTQTLAAATGEASPRSPLAGLPVVAAPTGPPIQLMQHRVYIATKQRYGTAQVPLDARARDLVMDITEKEYVPVDVSQGGGGGWVIFDCCPQWGIGECHVCVCRRCDAHPSGPSERPLREYEMITDVIDARPTPDDYFLLKRTELAPYLSFRAIPTSSPLLAGYVYVQDHKRKWSKRWLELRDHSLYHAKSDKVSRSNANVPGVADALRRARTRSSCATCRPSTSTSSTRPRSARPSRTPLPCAARTRSRSSRSPRTTTCTTSASATRRRTATGCAPS